MEFIKHCSEKGQSCRVLAWQLISFLSLPAEEQIAAIGPTEQWFLKEDIETNRGANYFFCVVLVLHEISGCRYFEEWSPDSALELENIVADLANNVQPENWTQEVLRNGDTWRKIRQLSNQLLSEANIWVNLPKTPLWFPNYTEIWWKDYRDLAKGKLLEKGRRKY